MAAEAEASLLRQLGVEHRRQLLDFLRFFRSRRRQESRELSAAFAEAKELRLLEDVYSRQDVESLLDSISALLQSNLDLQLERFTHQTALFLRQLYQQAEAQGAQLRAETSALEDAVLLEGLKRLDSDEAEARARSADAAAHPRKLAALGGAAVDVSLVARNHDLAEANAALTRDLADARVQLAELRAERAKRQREEQQRHTGDAALERLQREVRDLQEQLAAKVSATRQFQELRRIVQRKNAQLKEVRARLARYEAPSAGADDEAEVEVDAEQ